jgi:GNAT superfamily N-acetyltransferase
MTVNVRRASLADVPRLALLFDQYRQFYGKPSEPAVSEQFLTDRLARAESVVLLAEADGGDVRGFVQLFPSFSSVRAARIYVLNDLFVVPAARRSGVGSALLREAARVAVEAGAVKLKLSTSIANAPAQRLYEREGWTRDDEYYEYVLSL